MKEYNTMIKYNFTKNGLKIEYSFENLKNWFEECQRSITVPDPTFTIKKRKELDFIDSVTKSLIAPITIGVYETDKMLIVLEEVFKELISKNQDEDIKKWITKFKEDK